MLKSLSTLLFTTSLLISATQAQSNLLPTFRNDNPKNIAFFCAIGGSSHYNWVLDIGDELGSRGHNFTLITTDDDVRFGRPYKNIHVVSLGPSLELDHTEFFNDKTKEMATNNAGQFRAAVMELMFTNYEREYTFTRQYFIDNNIQLALCDHFADPCFEAAINLNIPFIITAAAEMTSETAAPYVNNNFNSMNHPTTETESFIDRFDNKFIKPIRGFKAILPVVKRLQARKIALGIDAHKLEDPTSKWKNSIKLTNSLFGFTAARPIGPMAEFVGPIISQRYEPLTKDLETYLDTHRRVAYVAFGQTATPSERDIQLILTGLLGSIERGDLDGFIWATVHAVGRFPDSIKTSSGTVYSVQDMFDQVNPHAHMVRWAPQTAILQHPSTILFVSHGGLGSWYESMYTGTRMIIFPFFGDQPGNAAMIEASKLGGILKNEHSAEQAAELFRKVILDETGEIADAVKRTQALVQIYSRHGVIRGADIVEEVAYTNKNGKLPHRESADHRMSYIKSHNLDLYGALALIISTSLWVITMITKMGYRLLFRPSLSTSQKIKTI